MNALRPRISVWIESLYDAYARWVAPASFIAGVGVLFLWSAAYNLGAFFTFCIVPGAAVVAIRWLRRSEERRAYARLKSRLCIGCGYDLRATPDRCPECGQPVPPELSGREFPPPIMWPK